VTTLFLFVALFAFLIIGMPIAISLGLSSLLTILLFANDSMASLALKFFQTAELYTLLAIPFFVLAGAFMTTGGVARRMIAFANACVGHMYGGLAIASVVACMLFAAVSGSSPATVVAVGSIVIAGMVRAGYTQTFAAGVVCNAGTLGILIPPSLVMVVYAAATESSVGRLFMAGVIPGALLGLMLATAIYISARVNRIPRQPRAPLAEVIRTGRNALWGLLLIVIIMGGIYGGIFTPTEAAAVSAVYAAVVALFVYRDLKFTDVPHVLVDAAKVTVMLLFIIANAFLFAHVLTTEQIPRHHRSRAGALAVPAGGQHHPAGRRQLHGALGDHPDPGADPVPDRHRSRDRPDPFRHHHGGEHGDRHGHATGRAQPVRDIGHHRHAGVERGEGRMALADDPDHLPDHHHLCAGNLALAAQHPVRQRHGRLMACRA
jgi:C4-dicarboxylate transporter DctM subunit